MLDTGTRVDDVYTNMAELEELGHDLCRSLGLRSALIGIDRQRYRGIARPRMMIFLMASECRFGTTKDESGDAKYESTPIGEKLLSHWRTLQVAGAKGGP